jgi:hypothetical protein
MIQAQTLMMKFMILLPMMILRWVNQPDGTAPVSELHPQVEFYARRSFSDIVALPTGLILLELLVSYTSMG